jgi:transcriptional regulator with XRE-family HTH domain
MGKKDDRWQDDAFEVATAKAVGALIGRYLKTQPIDKGHIARELRCSERAVTSYLQGQRRVSIAGLIRLARLFKVSPGQLILEIDLQSIPLAKKKFSDL